MLTITDLNRIEKIIGKKLISFTARKELNQKLQQVEKRLKEEIKNLPTKDEFYQAMDKLMKELKSHRDERAAFKFRIKEHGERITSLEEIHPAGQHPSA